MLDSCSCKNPPQGRDSRMWFCQRSLLYFFQPVLMKLGIQNFRVCHPVLGWPLQGQPHTVVLRGQRCVRQCGLMRWRGGKSLPRLYLSCVFLHLSVVLTVCRHCSKLMVMCSLMSFNPLKSSIERSCQHYHYYCGCLGLLEQKVPQTQRHILLL